MQELLPPSALRGMSPSMCLIRSMTNKLKLTYLFLSNGAGVEVLKWPVLRSGGGSKDLSDFQAQFQALCLAEGVATHPGEALGARAIVKHTLRPVKSK